MNTVRCYIHKQVLKPIDEGAVIFYAPVKTTGPTGSSLCLPGIAATAAAQLLRGFTRGTFL